MTLAAAFLVLATAGSARAVQVSELPIEIQRLDREAQELQLALRPAVVAQLVAASRLELCDWPLPDGSRVELELQRLDTRNPIGWHVDGNPAPELLDGFDLSVWLGGIAGCADSEVALSFSQAGGQGWVRRGEELFHLLSTSPDDLRLVSEQRLLTLRADRSVTCAAAPDDIVPQRAAQAGTAAKAGGSPALYSCRIAIETDWQLHQVFGGNLPAQAAYVASLLTWVSHRFEEQVGTAFSYPYVQFYTTPNDPWTSQDQGGDCIDLLYEFKAAWVGNIPAGADLAHFLSGANLGCGVAYLAGLCDPTRNFAVSGNIDGQTQFPIQVSPSNLNFYLVCHELGHNFNAIHTHAYCPPIDQCAPAGYFGPCQTQKVCTSQGTLMSYCHGCPGGFLNITTYFHPDSVADMRAWVELTCLPLHCDDPVPYCSAKVNSQGCTPAVGWSGHPTLSGLDDFVVTAELVLNNQNGMLFHGRGAASKPFLGGTLCVASPIVRTAVQSSGGNPPPSDCSGAFAYAWSHAQLAFLGAGTSVCAQFWYRDALSPGGTGLTDALAFTVCN